MKKRAPVAGTTGQPDSLCFVTYLDRDTTFEIRHLTSAHECDTDTTNLSVAHGYRLITDVDIRVS